MYIQTIYFLPVKSQFIVYLSITAHILIDKPFLSHLIFLTYIIRTPESFNQTTFRLYTNTL